MKKIRGQGSGARSQGPGVRGLCVLTTGYWLLTTVLFAAPLRWTCSWPDAGAQSFALYRGETATFEPRLKINGVVATNAEIAAVWYTTNTMSSVASGEGGWWRLDNATFAPSNDVGAVSYRFFVEFRDQGSGSSQESVLTTDHWPLATETIYRANGTLRMLPSPGVTPNALPLPAKTIDFAEVEVENAPWPAEIEAAIAEIPTPDLSDYATHADVAEAIAEIDFTPYAMHEDVAASTDAVYQASCTYADNKAAEMAQYEGGLALQEANIYTDNAVYNATNDIPTTITNVVTKEFVEDLGIKPADPAYSWVRPDAWTIDVEIDKSEQQGAVTVISEETDSVGRIWSNETFIATFGMAAKCSAALLDESSLNIPQIESWSALPPGGTIDSSGHFTAATSGLYRVSATATDGTTRYADVAISAERTVTNSNVRTYMADAVGGLRKSLNDDGLADLEGANLVSSNRYGTTWYTVYDIEPPRWSEPGGWVFHPFAIAPRILATCGHGIWEGRDGLYESHTFSNSLGVTYTLNCNLHWVILRDWALTNGFTAAEAAAVDDLAVNFATYVPRGTGDTDTGIDPSILPSFFTPESFERRLGGDAMGLIGWHQGQDHAQPFPISFIRKKFTNWGAPSAWGAALRRDIYSRLFEMDFLSYPIHGGDSGCPVYLRSHTLGDIVVAHHTNVMGCLADYIAGYKIIKAFAAAHGQTLKEVE